MTTKLNKSQFEKTVQLTKDQIDSNHALVGDILTKVVIETLRTYQQKVNIGLVDSISDTIDRLKHDIVSEVLNRGRTWLVGQNQQPLLFPKNCRFLYTVGRRIIAVIEESPGPRTLKLDANLLVSDTSNNAGVVHNHYLALPYSVFILVFDSDRSRYQNSFVGGYLYWNKQPLRTIDDVLYKNFLPNMHSTMAICFGEDLKVDLHSSLSQKVERVLGYFWDSNFNCDLSDRWFKRVTRDRSLEVEQWEELTKINPLVALSWPLETAMTLDEAIKRSVSEDSRVEVDMEKVKQSILEVFDKASDNIEYGIMKYLKKTKFNRFYPNDVIENLSSAISTITKEIVVVLDRMTYDLHQLQEDDLRRKKDISHYGWESRGVLWE